LEAAVMDFSGTIVFVSHDRYFINKIADQVVETQPNHVQVYLGDYDYFIAKKKEETELKELMEAEQEREKADTAKTNYHKGKEEQREQRRNNRKISTVERQNEDQESQLEIIEK